MTRGTMADVALPLICLECRSSLEQQAEAYRCRACGATYPLTGGILRMLPSLGSAEHQVKKAFDFEHYRYRNARYLRIFPTLVEDWLQDVQLPRDYFSLNLV